MQITHIQIPVRELIKDYKKPTRGRVGHKRCCIVVSATLCGFTVILLPNV